VPWQPALITEFEDDSFEALDRSTARLATIGWGRHLTLVQTATLDTFLYVDCMRAKQFFQMPVWTPMNPEMPVRTVSIVDKSYAAQNVGPYMRVTLQLRARL